MSRYLSISAKYLVLVAMDFLMSKTVDAVFFCFYGITWGTRKLADLDYANNIALISDSSAALQNMTT